MEVKVLTSQKGPCCTSCSEGQQGLLQRRWSSICA